jgi:hypothetical protein
VVDLHHTRFRLPCLTVGNPDMPAGKRELLASVQVDTAGGKKSQRCLRLRLGDVLDN